MTTRAATNFLDLNKNFDDDKRVELEYNILGLEVSEDLLFDEPKKNTNFKHELQIDFINNFSEYAEEDLDLFNDYQNEDDMTNNKGISAYLAVDKPAKLSLALSEKECKKAQNKSKKIHKCNLVQLLR